MSEGSCVHHPDRPLHAPCSRCGDFICRACVASSRDGRPLCAACDARRGAAPAEPIPWEDPTEAWWRGFFKTAWLSLRHPRAFFQRVNPQGGWIEPLLYLVGCWCFTLAGGLLQGAALLLAATREGATDPQAAEFAEMAQGMWSGLHESVVLLLLGIGGGVGLALLGVVCWALVYTAAVHLALVLIGADNEGFVATWRLSCYTAGVQLVSAATSVAVVALGAWHTIATLITTSAGSLIGLGLMGYAVVLTGVGVLYVQRASMGRVIGGLVVALVVGALTLCGCYLLAVVPVWLLMPQQLLMNLPG